VTIGWEALRTGVGSAVMDYGQLISAAAARRIACDCKIIPVVLGGDSEPLDVGRAMRTVPVGIRRALVARDGGCAFRAATDRLDCAKPITASTGSTMALPQWRTAACCARRIITKCTGRGGMSPSVVVASNSGHPG
jgi:Domain of unknown function (DUF222)